jgi:ABC-type oligopeptide transport system substrate-binding subunit
MPRRTFLVATLAAAASSACGFSNDNSSSGDDDQAEDSAPAADDDGDAMGGVLKLSLKPVAHIDPAIVGNAANGEIMMVGLWEGLVVHDPDDPSAVLPGVAETWDVSDDGLTYTFHLRSDASWSTGDPVTANDLEWNWKRLLTPGIGGENDPSYNHALAGVVNADKYMSGEISDFAEVGVTAVDEATLEIVIEAPNADFMIQMAEYRYLPLHPATVEELGDHEWLDPANWVSNGAYVLQDFRVNQGAVLAPNEHYWDRANYHLERIEVSFNDGGTTADLLAYQESEIHITHRIEDDIEAVTTSDVASELISTPPNQIRQLIVMNSRNLALHDVRVRKALSLAIDRQLLGEISKPAVTGNSMIPEIVANSDLVPGVEDDPEAAAALLAEAGFPGGEGMPTIQIMQNQPNPWVEAIAQMWLETLNVKVAIDMVETAVLIEKRLELHDEDYTGFYAINTSVSPPTLQMAAQRTVPSVATIGVYAQNLMPPEAAQEFLDAQNAGAALPDLIAIADENRYPEPNEAITLARQGLAETDPDAQRDLLVSAAIARDESYCEIPVLWGGYNLLVKPQVKDIRLIPFTSVLTTKGVYVEQ